MRQRTIEIEPGPFNYDARTNTGALTQATKDAGYPSTVMEAHQ